MNASAKSTMIVSACLLGRRCRYDGQASPSDLVQARVDAWKASGGVVTAVCPEELGELPTPRPAAELRGGDGGAVLDGTATVEQKADDKDLSAAFVQGAQAALARAPGASCAILKARSPSCGVGETWIDGELKRGDGVFAALLRRAGVEVEADSGATQSKARAASSAS